MKRNYSSKLVYYLLAIIFLLGPSVTYAQQGSKIAFVDSRYFTDGITEFRQQKETLDKEFKPNTDQLQQLNEQIQVNEEVLKRTVSDLTPEARQRKMEELERQKKDYNRKLEDTKEGLNKKAETALGPLREKISKTLDAYAKERNIDLVIDIAPAIQMGTLAYIAPGVEITEEFIKIYNTANPGKK